MLKVWLKRIGQEIKNRRKALGYETQEAFAAYVNLSLPQLGRMERGSRSYTIGPLLEILTGGDDPVKALVSISKGLNSVDGPTVELCRRLLLLSDEQQAIVSKVVGGMLKADSLYTADKDSPRSR